MDGSKMNLFENKSFNSKHNDVGEEGGSIQAREEWVVETSREQIRGLEDLSQGLVIHPDNNWWYNALEKLILIVVAIYCTYTTTCIFYYLPTSMYFSIVTMAIVAVILKGSKTFRYRDKMPDLTKYMTGNILGSKLHNEIKGHSRLQYESSYTDAVVLQMFQTLYQSYVENIPIFKGCSQEFINEIVTRVHEDFFLPGEVIMEQWDVVDQLYFVCQGALEEVGIGADGLEVIVSLLQPNSSLGEIPILCKIPQPYTVRACEQCRLLRVDRQSFSNILDIYFHDGRKVLTNLLEGKESNLRLKQLKMDIMVHIGKQDTALALRVNNAAFCGDLFQLKSLIRSGADPNKKDYSGNTAPYVIHAYFLLILLFPPFYHLTALRGYEDITLFLIQESVDINAEDNFGNTPLLEAIKNGHDKVASLLSKKGAKLKIDNAGSYLCSVVARGDSDLLRRLLSNGLDPNSKDYDHRSPLHIAASQGLYLMGKLLVDAEASVMTKDKSGNSPIDEARIWGNKNMIRYLEEAKTTHGVTHAKKRCNVLPCRPWDPPVKGRKSGVRMWVPPTMEELIKAASHKLRMLDAGAKCIILCEDGCQITDVDMIMDMQLLYLIYETD
ncbi:potassium channel SKOR-like [Salvia divinorum]|uniref:Potassium channel n=1 Tax=Salvia divinorum TaxID=28513 RepID=A0ABD1IDG5_SALDI